MGELARTGEEPNLSHIAALWPVLLMTVTHGYGFQECFVRYFVHALIICA